MLPLTRPVRQTIATLGLLAFAVAPTTYVIYTAWSISRPAHLRQVEAEFRRELGLLVSLGSIRYPRPGEVVFGGVVIRQDESRKTGPVELARAESIHLKRGSGELTLESQGLKVRGEGASQILAQFNGLLLRAVGSDIRRIALAMPTCDLTLGQGPKSETYQVRDVAGVLLPEKAAPSATVSYRMADERGSTRCELALTRETQGGPIRTTIDVKTMEGQPMAANVLNPLFDAGGWLGPDARIWGSLSLSQLGNADWTALFQGELTEIDLNRLVSERFPAHRLAGLAKLSVKSARWSDRPGQGSGWVEARGELTAGQGAISAGLIQALAAEMKFRPSTKLRGLDSGRDVEFRALGLAFHLSKDGEIQIGGGLGGEYQPDAVLVSTNQVDPIARSPQGTANVRGLIKTLFPGDASTLVPGTAESQVVQRYLPLPPGLADSGDRGLKGN